MAERECDAARHEYGLARLLDRLLGMQAVAPTASSMTSPETILLKLPQRRDASPGQASGVLHSLATDGACDNTVTTSIPSNPSNA